jgi:hypothetical protein
VIGDGTYAGAAVAVNFSVGGDSTSQAFSQTAYIGAGVNLMGSDASGFFLALDARKQMWFLATSIQDIADAGNSSSMAPSPNWLAHGKIAPPGIKLGSWHRLALNTTDAAAVTGALDGVELFKISTASTIGAIALGAGGFYTARFVHTFDF